MNSDTNPEESAEPDEVDSHETEVVEAEIVEDSVLEPDAGSVSSIELDLPDDPAEALPVLIGELMASRVAAGEATDNWKRAVAEYENLRKRSQRDQATLISRSSERVVLQLLPVLDSLDAALALEPETDNEAKMSSGMAGTKELLLSILAREGLERITSIGATFDPELHEAVQVGQGSGTMVVEAELRGGYTFSGKVLRASLVAVGYESGGETEEQEETE